MSDKNIGKKAVERIELEPFLGAYQFVTGEHLSVVACLENPDFICERPSGAEVGVELTKVTRDPRDVFWEKILDRKEHIDPYVAQEYIHHLVEKKERARTARYTVQVNETILVLQIIDGSLDVVQVALEGLEEDFTDHGFCEIWLADYSGLEAYGDIELFGLYPKPWWGYHQRLWPDRKPYG